MCCVKVVITFIKTRFFVVVNQSKRQIDLNREGGGLMPHIYLHQMKKRRVLLRHVIQVVGHEENV